MKSVAIVTRALFVGMFLSGVAVCPASGQSVSDLWKNNCANCHGETGKGGGHGTQTLLSAELFGQEHDQRFFNAIKNGVPDNGMAAFGETMKDEQIWGLVVYIRELQARALRRESGSPKATDGVYAMRDHRFRIETVIDSGLDVPWSVDFLPDGRMLVTSRTGELKIHSSGKAGGRLEEAVTGTPRVLSMGQGGLMDVAVHPDYAKNGWVYLAYSDAGAGGRNQGMTKLVRGKLDANGKGGTVWTNQETIFEAKPEHYLGGGLHFGCRIVFTEPVAEGGEAADQGKRYLFFAIGERGRGEMAQDLSRPNGKVHRVWDDGKIPADNPFVKTSDAYATIWSYGHRNPQGLAFGIDGKLWDTEHGPRGGDEVNLVEKGKNYGWPVVSFGINYNGAPFKAPWTNTGEGTSGELVMPVFRWLPSIGACGLDVARGPAFAAWKGDLLAGGLSGANVDRIRIKDGKFIEREELVHGMGRVRDVVCGPDGTVYVVLNDPDKVIRLVPAGE